MAFIAGMESCHLQSPFNPDGVVLPPNVVVIDVDNDSVREEESETPLGDALPQAATRRLLVYIIVFHSTMPGHTTSF